MPSEERTDSTSMHRAVRRGFWIATLLTVGMVAWMEYSQFRGGRKEVVGVPDWFANMLVDSSPFVVMFTLLPLFWFPRRRILEGATRLHRAAAVWFGATTKPGTVPATFAATSRAIALAVFVGGVSVFCSWSVSRTVIDSRQDVRFGDLPPAYHDEYSYLLQAKTFLAGRLSFPSHHDAAEVFDQNHVVNEGRYASRYFPATGAWIAPFLAAGNPYWGHWLAGALTAAFVFAAGRELGGNGVGFLAGLLTALSPGMAVFGNLLLAHHPTLVGLSLFLFAFLRMSRTGHWLPAMIAGIGLTFAMLARPMTAAGFGLPFGIWFVAWLFRRQGESATWPFRLSRVAATAGPILAGFALLMNVNDAITGNPLRMPYDLYTDTYTPRHAYGFDNVDRAAAPTKTTFEKYDRWAKNLTPRMAARNVWNRLRASSQRTLGIVPLVLAACVFLSCRHRDEGRWWLIAAAIASLHLAHVPYWYDGIAHWHYVFETGPLWLLLFARVTQMLWGAWRESGRGWMPVWWCGLIFVALAPAYFSNTPFWGVSRVDAEVADISFSRWRYREFRQLIDRRVTEPRALVLIAHDPAEIHFDYVSNEPNLRGEQRLLLGRFVAETMNLDDIAAKFPDRAVYLFDVRTRGLPRVSLAK